LVVFENTNVRPCVAGVPRESSACVPVTASGVVPNFAGFFGLNHVAISAVSSDSGRSVESIRVVFLEVLFYVAVLIASVEVF
jgi:hypothetical protein